MFTELGYVVLVVIVSFIVIPKESRVMVTHGGNKKAALMVSGIIMIVMGLFLGLFALTKLIL